MKNCEIFFFFWKRTSAQSFATLKDRCNKLSQPLGQNHFFFYSLNILHFKWTIDYLQRKLPKIDKNYRKNALKWALNNFFLWQKIIFIDAKCTPLETFQKLRFDCLNCLGWRNFGQSSGSLKVWTFTKEFNYVFFLGNQQQRAKFETLTGLFFRIDKFYLTILENKVLTKALDERLHWVKIELEENVIISKKG